MFLKIHSSAKAGKQVHAKKSINALAAGVANGRKIHRRETQVFEMVLANDEFCNGNGAGPGFNSAPP